MPLLHPVWNAKKTSSHHSLRFPALVTWRRYFVYEGIFSECSCFREIRSRRFSRPRRRRSLIFYHLQMTRSFLARVNWRCAVSVGVLIFLFQEWRCCLFSLLRRRLSSCRSHSKRARQLHALAELFLPTWRPTWRRSLICCRCFVLLRKLIEVDLTAALPPLTSHMSLPYARSTREQTITVT